VARLDQTSSQPDHHALGPTVPGDRDPAMEVEGDVHAGPMYWARDLSAKLRGE
jgi:hypothetical protein